MEKAIFDRIFNYFKKKKTLKEVATELCVSEYEVLGVVYMMKDEGYLIDYIDGEIVLPKKPPKVQDVYEIPNNTSRLKLLSISDTHLCSKYDRVDILKYLYKKADERDVHHVLHSGDFTDGMSHRPEHMYELRELSYEGQVGYCVKNYPKLENGGKTYVISGNHDDWWYKQNGSEIIKSIAKERDDIVYLGAGSADLKIGKLRIRLFHGVGGPAYAKSYKLQKYVDMIPADELPDMVQTGHIHEAFFMLKGGTYCYQTGSIEDLTPYAKTKGYPNDKSCWWIDMQLDEKGHILSVVNELETFGRGITKKRK